MQPAHVRSTQQGRGRAALVLALVLVAGLASTAGYGNYRVRAGDTLWGLAQRSHTTVKNLQAVNGLRGTVIQRGQLLTLPGAGGGATAAAGGASTYLVHRGETLSGIARHTGVPLRTLAARNGLRAPYVIFAGRSLVIGGSTATTTTANPSGSLAGTIAAHRAELAAVAQPTRSEVRSMIRTEAARRGVEPALALGIALVESGFNQHAVSRTDAVGVMQLMPATASWLGGLLGFPLDRMQASQNISGGVALLHTLLGQASLRTAIAGYYQGLGSVRQHGMYSDTKRYVTTVLGARAQFR